MIKWYCPDYNKPDSISPKSAKILLYLSDYNYIRDYEIYC